MTNHLPTTNAQAASWTRRMRGLAWLLIAIGVLLRLGRYLDNRSLWHDEASIALNLVNRSLAGLFEPLEYVQTVPVGTLVLQKCSVMLLGANEMAFRLVSFLAGVLSLPVFYGFVKRWVNARAGLIALALVVFSEMLIFYAADTKHYALDFLVALLFLSLGVQMLHDGVKGATLAAWGLTGVLGVWVSHPAVFVLSGVGGVLLIHEWFAGRKSAAGRLGLTLLVGWASFAGVFWLNARNSTMAQALQGYWSAGFWPVVPRSLTEALWLPRTFINLFTDPLGIKAWALAAALCIIGITVLYQTQRRMFFLLSTPIFLTLLASALHQYPFVTSERFEVPLWGRVVVFLMPVFLLFIAVGLDAIWRNLSAYQAVAGWTLLGILLGPCIMTSVQGVGHPPGVQEVRPLLALAQPDLRAGDVLYVSWGADYPFRYYRKSYVPDQVTVLKGHNFRRNWVEYDREFQQLRGHRRVWVLVSYLSDWNRIDDARLYRFLLDRMGTKVKEYQADHAVMYLYDLSTPEEGLEGGESTGR